METFTIDGVRFGYEVEADESMRAPWDEHDGHGVIFERERPARREYKRAGWRALGDSHWYDVPASIAKARREKWGMSPDALVAFHKTHGREPTTGEIAAAAVEADFSRMLAWCRGDWCWVGVTVRLLDEHDDDIDTGIQIDSIWGIESDCPDYIESEARGVAMAHLEALRADERGKAARKLERTLDDLHAMRTAHSAQACVLGYLPGAPLASRARATVRAAMAELRADARQACATIRSTRAKLERLKGAR